MEIFVLYIIFCLLIGMLGSSRKIGGGLAFFLSLILSPLLGLIFTLLSSKKPDENHRELMQMQQLQYQALLKNTEKEIPVPKDNPELDELKKEKLSAILDDWADGKITEEEYKIKKEKIMLL